MMKHWKAFAAVGVILFVTAIAVIFGSTYQPVESDAKKIIAEAEQAINKPVEKPKPFVFEYDRGASSDAYEAAKVFVSNKLKAPATAQYAPFDMMIIKTSPGFKWSVMGYVDSQNGFGALVRRWFRAEMTYEGKGNYRLDGLIFWE